MARAPQLIEELDVPAGAVVVRLRERQTRRRVHRVGLQRCHIRRIGRDLHHAAAVRRMRVAIVRGRALERARWHLDGADIVTQVASVGLRELGDAHAQPLRPLARLVVEGRAGAPHVLERELDHAAHRAVGRGDIHPGERLIDRP